MNIDIINVAGLLMDGMDDGLEASLRKRLQPRFIRTIAPTPPRAAREHPNESIQRAIADIQVITKEIRALFGEPHITLTGRSNGGFIALLAACRMDFVDILAAISIESPLHPEVEVKPPLLLPPLQLCGSHYEHRASIAREAADFVPKRSRGKLVMIQGGSADDVVPPEAQKLPGNFDAISLENMDVNMALQKNGRGLVVTLPAWSGGKSDGFKRALPAGYRNHLFWSDEKMHLVTDVIANIAQAA